MKSVSPTKACYPEQDERNPELDLLDDAGIPPPRSPILTDDDRAALASTPLAQRQFYFVFVFFVGMVAGAVVAYFIGYNDVVRTIVKWTLSGTGLALIVSARLILRNCIPSSARDVARCTSLVLTRRGESSRNSAVPAVCRSTCPMKHRWSNKFRSRIANNSHLQNCA
jgi:hypothetical protein